MKLSELKTANSFFESLPTLSQELPFPLFPKLVKGESVKVAGFEVARLRSLTVGEELAYGEFVANHLEEGIPDLVYKMVLATILLISRYDLDWTFEQTYTLNAQAIDALYQFFRDERNPEPVAEPEPEPEATTAKKKSTGRKSSGALTDASQETSDSDTTASELVLSAS